MLTFFHFLPTLWSESRSIKTLMTPYGGIDCNAANGKNFKLVPIIRTKSINDEKSLRTFNKTSAGTGSP